MDINLIKNFIPNEQAINYFNVILADTIWHNELKVQDQDVIVKIKRKMAYVSDSPVVYKYANLELPGVVWTDTLASVRDLVIKELNKPFNSVLLNLYETGKDEIRWHSDKEEQLGRNPVIACVNFGAARNFWFLDKQTGEKTPYFVESGDLLVMGENCQENYLHAILKEKGISGARISLTFRVVNL